MCFSAPASFAAAGTLGAAGALTVKKSTGKEIPFAAIPLLFALQQALEGIVWLSFGTPLLNAFAMYGFCIFALLFWPVFTPLSILLLEGDPVRKKLLALCLVLGAAVAVYLLYFLITEPLTSQIFRESIQYRFTKPQPFIIFAIYAVATCGACFISSKHYINQFGAALAISIAIAGWFYFETFTSVWCFFAAVLSAIIWWHFARRGAQGIAQQQ